MAQTDLLLLHPPDFIGRQPEAAVATIREERYIPLGPLYLASHLRRHGLRAMVAPLRDFYQERGCYLDYDDGSQAAVDRFVWKSARILSSLVQRLQPRAVGISLNYALHERAVELLLEVLRRDQPGLPVMLGGVHATLTAADWLRRPAGPDWVVLGEGEETCRRLLAADLQADGIPGLGWRTPAGHLELRPTPRLLGARELSHPLDLDLLALPRWSSFEELLHYVHFSRGCSWRCAFCCSPHIWGRRRLRDPETVATEIAALHRRGVRQVFVTDEALIPRSAGYEEILGVLGRFKDMRFCGLMRPDHLDRVDPEALRLANLELVYLGVESFSTRVLRAMNKGMTGRRFRTFSGALRRLRAAGVRTTLLIMLGYPHGGPGEDGRTVETCRRLAEEGLIWDLGVAHTAPFPGTALAREEGTSFRLLEPRRHHWNLSEPVIELVGRGGRVTYPAAQMAAAYRELESIRVRFGLGPYRAAGSRGLGLEGP
ncbi:MAG TPA: radical SAM protein [Myxococcota bacterium]|nr:radical SAM protein [Myxococcota bacterium]HRY94073.1 radical SAM protein [Myxococcota bacterium]HSA23147.1 radical SAM protein [Myxococcota bacterium]